MPVGGPEITGVSLEFLMSSALQPAKRQQDKKSRAIANFRLPIADFKHRLLFFNWQSAIGNRKSDILFLRFIYYSTFVLSLGERFTGDAIFTFNPPAEVDELAALRTEGTKRIVFPLDRLTAGWAFHVWKPLKRRGHQLKDAGRLISIRRLTNAIVPSRRMAFKRTVTLSRVEPTIEAISR